MRARLSLLLALVSGHCALSPAFAQAFGFGGLPLRTVPGLERHEVLLQPAHESGTRGSSPSVRLVTVQRWPQRAQRQSQAGIFARLASPGTSGTVRAATLPALRATNLRVDDRLAAGVTAREDRIHEPARVVSRAAVQHGAPASLAGLIVNAPQDE